MRCSKTPSYVQRIPSSHNYTIQGETEVEELSELGGLADTMGKAALSLGPLVTLEPFLLPQEYIKEVRAWDRTTGLIQHDDDIATYAFVRAHVAFEMDLANYEVFRTVKNALLPGTARGAVYIDIHFWGSLYHHIEISYRGIPDEVVRWVLKAIFNVDVTVAKRTT